MEVTTRKISKKEAKELYNELIQKDVDALTKEKSNDTRKYNTLNILNNVVSIFTGTYLHYKYVPKETMFERSIAERIKLRKERFDEIKTKEQSINNELFEAYFIDYQIPGSMYKKLSETKNAKIDKTRVSFIEKVLTKLKSPIKSIPNDGVFKIEENEKIMDIGERIEVNNEIQSGQGTKIITPNQMVSRLPIALAQ